MPAARKLFTFILALSIASGVAAAQYAATALVKNTGTKPDKQLINPWGLAYGPGNPFWLADAGSGLSTLYTGTGAKQGLVVTVPAGSGSGKGSPTGIVITAPRNSKSTAGPPLLFLPRSTGQLAAGRISIPTTP